MSDEVKDGYGVVKYNQPTSAPTAKVAAVGRAGAIAVAIPLIVTILASFGVIVPEGTSEQAVAAVSGAIALYSFLQAMYQFGAGYLKRSERKV